ncbi:MAG: hypothetical protein JNK27_06270 [Chitinophagaceae bacterium]|nr:hypothetical protein [Chitinophagaceae bacterium]
MRYLVRSFITLLWLFIYSSGFAQKDITSQSAKRVDLAITNVTVIEATSNPSTGLHKVKVSVTIQNNGDAPSARTSLKMLVQNQIMNLVAPPNPQPQNPWHQLGDNQPVNAIAPGQPVTEEYLFIETKKVITTSRFNMGVMADAGNQIKEINETDNRSAAISVTPVAERAEYVAVTPTVQTIAQLKKIDTLVYTIGPSDFKLSNREGDFGFARISTEGVSIGASTSFSGSRVYNSLVAPLHLPAGAVIVKISFMYINLSTSGCVPHLALRSRFSDERGGWVSVQPVTSYWIAGTERTENRNGLADVKSSVTPAGFRVRIADNASYNFEVLADENARSATIPTSSLWPRNGTLFVWGINVHYSLN